MNLINPAWIDLRDLRFVSFELLVFKKIISISICLFSWKTKYELFVI